MLLQVTSLDEICTNLAVRDIIEAVTATEQTKKTELFCLDHPTKKCTLACTDCCQLVCAVCMKSTHKGHNVDDVDDAVINMKQRLHGILRKKIADLERASSHEQLIKSTTPYLDAVNFIGTILGDALDAWEQDCLLDRKTFINKQSERCKSLKSYWEEKLDVSDFPEITNVFKEINKGDLDVGNSAASLSFQESDIDWLQEKLISACGTARVLVKNGAFFSASACTTAKLRDGMQAASKCEDFNSETNQSLHGNTSSTSSCATVSLEDGLPAITSYGDFDIEANQSNQEPDSQTDSPEATPDTTENARQLTSGSSTRDPQALQSTPEQPSSVLRTNNTKPRYVLSRKSSIFGIKYDTVERADGTTILDEMQRGLSSAPPFYSLIHLVSADFQMDEKLALELKKFGGLEELRCFSAQVGQIAFLKRNSRFIYYTVVKETYDSIPTMRALESCLRCVRDHCLENQMNFLAIGRPNDLDWHEVRQLLIDMFYDTPIRIAAYMGHNRMSLYCSMLD